MRDMLGMMGKIKELQANMERMQAELETLEVTGAAGGGLVSVTVNGKGVLKKVSIDPSLMKADEKEIVEDLIVAASADARAKSEKLVEEKAKALTGGLPLPPGMKLF
ncbi:MAG: YbaB/EbfC family nucleoid-associated protein [Xanthobacteraceae bacterium]|nr:YbaB/EbfC family nucleoid-associated protein [Xanthobacteraceae bacterium]MBX3533815.1 YbaB/EbfC family nucleoid-associated protein [Xanthobacteraceae bacterium]MBX3549342.1 YbaB/EbfC family nucleoid-associated protein [Xanthobacteraceae bacterium]MCW5673577.1 YbaB/EbfC family nucleoid-associated protein [Xanthobacteraceae bacterium]MCW5678921.1 YbaB/EbfC family nucleoid-associated protein [Xanthobacteraceae bacterium]